MIYVSTRGQAPELGFEDAMMTGLARDGGLYVPASIPRLADAVIADMAGKPYEQVAFDVMRPFLGGAFDDATFRRLIRDAYAGFAHPARAPLRQLDANHWLMELFHGPTLAFKDFAMQLIGRMFAESLGRSGRRLTVVGATSGDTGSAAMEAFRGLPGVDVFVLYPHGRVSDVQRRQMTTPTEGNVHAIAVDGDFDTCQRAVKAMFADEAFRDEVSLAGVNSINWARVLAQVVYYFHAATALGAPGRAIDFCVPTGNFGDVYAGSIARAMGLPIGRLVVATNRNDILDRTLRQGAYVTTGVHPTISPSMDIQVSSNFERALFDAYGRDAHAVRADMAALREAGRFDVAQGGLQALREVYASGRASEAETADAIRRTHARTGELLCPHSAVGVHVAEAHLRAAPMVTLATAHPAKFPDAVEAATGLRPPLPAHMADLFERPEHILRASDDLSAIQALIRDRQPVPA
ncbi:MAG: threonine synthase [Paracoccaceae bacterium]